MIRNRFTLTGLSYASMFFLGIGAAIVGAASRNIGLTPYQIGLLLAVQNVGFMFSVIVVGSLADVFDKAVILALGSLVLSVSFFLFYRWEPFAVNCLFMAFVGVGSGCYEGATDAMLLEIHPTRQSLHVSINHLFVTLGSLMITLYLIFLQMDWARSTNQAAAAVLFIAALYAVSRAGTPRAGGESLTQKLRILRTEPVVFALFFSAMFALGLEMGSVGILTTFLMELRGFDQISSKVGLIVFVSGVAAGRLLLGLASRRGRLLTIMLVIYASAVLFFSLLFFLPLGTVPVHFLLFLSGLAVSSLLPLTISMGGMLFSGMAGTALGVIKLAIPIGGIVIPLLLSLLSRVFSFRMSLILFPALACAGLAVLLASRSRLVSAERPAERPSGETDSEPR